jgi:phosphohistidine phosphatase SixA
MDSKGSGYGFSLGFLLGSCLGRRGAVVVLCSLALCGLGAAPSEAPAAKAQASDGQATGLTTVILVRHAEKASEPRQDPPLTPQGEARASWLGEVLSGAGVEHIYSTDTLRTRSTAGLIAEALGLEVTVVPPRDLEAMAAALRSHRGQVVVSVGHSNTLGPLAERLGAEPMAPIAEDDYEGFFVLTLAEDASAILPLRLSMPAQESPAAQR